MDEIALLNDAVVRRQECGSEAGDERDTCAGCSLQAGHKVANPGRANVYLGEGDGSAWIAVFILSPHGEHLTHTLAGSPGDGGHGRNSKAFVDFSSTLIIDSGDDAFDAIGLAGHPGREDVRVISTAHRGECVGSLDPGVLQCLAIETDSGDRESAEIRG